MTVDLTAATSPATVAGYGLAQRPGGDVHGERLRTRVGAQREPAVINGGHGSEHCVEVQCTADEGLTTVAAPLGERNLVNDHTHDHGYHRRLDGTCSYCSDTHPTEPDIPMQVFDRATGSWIVESILSEAA